MIHRSIVCSNYRVFIKHIDPVFTNLHTVKYEKAAMNLNIILQSSISIENVFIP